MFSSSFQLIGMSECQARIKQLVDDAKEMAGLPQDTTLEGLVSTLIGKASSCPLAFVHSP